MKKAHIRLLALVSIWLLVMPFNLMAMQSKNESGSIPIHLDSLYHIDQTLADSYYEEMLKTQNHQGLEGKYLEIIYLNADQAFQEGDYLKAIQDCLHHLSIQSDKTTETAEVFRILGNSYFYLNDNILALDAYIKAKKINEAINDSVNLSTSFSSIALIYNRSKNYTQALVHNKISLVYRKALGLNTISSGYLNIGRSYFKLEKFDSSKYYLDSAYAFVKKYEHSSMMPYVLRSYSDMYVQAEKYDSALIYISQSIEKAKTQESKEDLFVGVVDISDNWLRSSRYDETIAICLQYLPMAHELRNYPRVIEISKRLYLAFIGKGMYEEAVNVERQFRPIQDSLDHISISNAKRRIQLRFESEKQAAENKLLRQERTVQEQTIKAQHLLLYISFFGLILTVLICFIVYKAFSTKKKMSNQNQMHADQLIRLDGDKSRFFANLSYDLNKPLNLMIASIAKALGNDDILLGSETAKQLKTALQNGNRIIHLTNETEELIRIEEGKLKINKQHVDLDPFLKLFTSIFDHQANAKGIKLVYTKSIFDRLPIVDIDPQQFEKVLFNLMIHAFAHTPQGESITIALDKKEDQLMLSFRNTGEGIPEESIPTIFDRPYQPLDASLQTQGFGISLALVKEIITRHSIQIELRSKVEVGSEFIITLPIQGNSNHKALTAPDLSYSLEKQVLFGSIDI